MNNQFFYPEKTFYQRFSYQDIKTALTSDLIITLTGLRRVGKSTLMKQILCDLLNDHPRQNIFYFSFDESIVKRDSEALRRIIETYAVFILRRPFNTIAQKIYLFLDEIQIIPYWQDIIKTYSDLNKNLQFIVSGSSSL